MTDQEKIARIKEIEEAFIKKMDAIKSDYLSKVRQIVKEVEQKKIEKIKQDLYSQKS